MVRRVYALRIFCNSLITNIMNRYLTALAAVFVFFCSCGSDEKKVETSAPQLVSSVPADGATGVDISTSTITLTFDQEVFMGNGFSFNEKELTLSNVKKSAIYNLIITLPEPLQRGSTYTLSVGKGAVRSSAYDETEAFSITFSTEAKPESAITNKLATSNPMAGTQKIFDNIVAQYGQSMLSATMANVNWNLAEAELVKSATGKYPAMATMDYIHLFTQRSDNTGSWKVDYSLNEEVKAWVAEGGLLAASWHWMVPEKEGGTANDKLVYDEKAPFSPSKVMTEGTTEYEWAQEDLRILVGYVKQLQDAGITLFFRPLHEASGNSIAGGSSWFWWGKEGAEVYKKLWIYLFNYFKDNGINNCIWVWTTQTGYDYRNKLGADEDWYPGDEYVDIIGKDEYNKTVDQSVAEFEFISSTFPNKIITLSECGNVGKVSEMWQKGARWSYIMPWYQYNATTLDGHEHANTQWWSDAIGSECVVTRDEMASYK